MIKIIGILAVAMVIIIIEVPPLLRSKQKKVLSVFSLLLLYGVAVSIAQSSRWNIIPNPLDWITFIYKPLYESIFSMLK